MPRDSSYKEFVVIEIFSRDLAKRPLLEALYRDLAKRPLIESYRHLIHRSCQEVSNRDLAGRCFLESLHGDLALVQRPGEENRDLAQRSDPRAG